jgi:hypothetical protein
VREGKVFGCQRVSSQRGTSRQRWRTRTEQEREGDLNEGETEQEI